MAEVLASVDLPVTPAQAWAALVDWERQGTWMVATTVRPTRAGGVGVGAGVEAFTGLRLGPVRLGLRDPMTITAWDPPRRCEVRHTGRVIRGAGAFEIEDVASGCRFRWAEWLQPPFGWFGAAGFQLVRPAVRAGLRRSLRRFAVAVATAAPPDSGRSV